MEFRYVYKNYVVPCPGRGGGGGLEDFYPDVCVEGLEKDPF